MTRAFCRFALRQLVRIERSQWNAVVYSALSDSFDVISVAPFGLLKVGIATYSVLPFDTIKNYHPIPFFVFRMQLDSLPLFPVNIF